MPIPQLEALCKRVEKLQAVYPPIPRIEGPGFVMLNPIRPPDAYAHKLKRRERAETVLFALLGGLTGTALGATVWIALNL